MSGDYKNNGAADYLSSPKGALEDYGNDCNSVIFIANMARQNESLLQDTLKKLKEQNHGKLLLTIEEAKPQSAEAIKEKYPEIHASINKLVEEVNQIYESENVSFAEILEKMKKIIDLIKQTKT